MPVAQASAPASPQADSTELSVDLPALFDTVYAPKATPETIAAVKDEAAEPAMVQFD